METTLEPTEEDLEEIARLIKDGFTSGRIDTDEKHIYFEIKITCWKDY